MTTTLKNLREKAGLTQSQLALKSQVSQGYISQMESGEHIPSLDVAVCLAKVLGVPPYKVIGAAAGAFADKNAVATKSATDDADDVQQIIVKMRRLAEALKYHPTVTAANPGGPWQRALAKERASKAAIKDEDAERLAPYERDHLGRPVASEKSGSDDEVTTRDGRSYKRDSRGVSRKV